MKLTSLKHFTTEKCSVPNDSVVEMFFTAMNFIIMMNTTYGMQCLFREM